MFESFYSRAAVYLLTTIFLTVAVSGCDSGKASAPAGPNLMQQQKSALAIGDPERRAHELIAVALRQHKAQDFGGADESIGAARKACAATADKRAQALLYSKLTALFVSMDRKSDAETALASANEAANGMADAAERGNALAVVAGVQSRQLKQDDQAKEKFAAAMKLAEQLPDAESKTILLAAIAMQAAKSGLSETTRAALDQGVVAASTINDPLRKSNALVDLASQVAEKDPAGADQVFTAADLAAHAVATPYGQAYAMSYLGEKLIAAGRKEQARKLLPDAQAAAKQVRETDLQREAEGKVDVFKSKLGP